MTSRDRTSLILFFAVLLAAFFEAWCPGRTLFARDLTYLFHPMRVWTAEALQAGGMPLWNPFVSGGVPWLGQPQTGVFYPGNLLFWFFPFVSGFKLFQGAHFFLSGLGGYLWVRSSRGTRGQALAAALLWSLNGFWRSRAEFPPLLAVLAWTPWMGLFLCRGRGGILGLVGALAVTAGHWPQVVWSGVLVAVVAGFRRSVRVSKAVPLAAALAAMALFPGLELALRSSRAAGDLGSVAGAYALVPFQWLGLLWPWASAMPEFAYTGEKFFWLGCFFTGIAGFFWALRGWFKASRRMRRTGIGLFLVGAVLSLGAMTPVYPFLRDHVPPFGWVRFPAQLSFWMTAMVLVLATGMPGPWRRGAGTVVAVLLGTELLVYGFQMTPTIDADYFHRKPDWVNRVQEGGGRFFLTPRAAFDMRSSGNDFVEAWSRLRAKGLSLTTLPYHIKNVNPLGFSLNPKSTEDLLSTLYGASSYRAAEPLLDRLGVRWVASPMVLEAEGTVPRAVGPWHLHERTGLSVTESSRLWDPGWTGWKNGKRVRTFNEEGFLAVEEGSIEGVLFRFRPPAFRLGLGVSLLAWVGLCFLGFRRLRAPCL